VVEQKVGRLGLARPGLARDDDALVAPLDKHRVVGRVGDGEYVRREVAQPPVLVELDILFTKRKRRNKFRKLI
jgi:hypothetical protein